MTPEQVALILGAIFSGGVLTKIVDVIYQGLKDSRVARGSSKINECARVNLEAAFFSEQLQETRELYLKEGGDPKKLGPPPRYKAVIDSNRNIPSETE